MANAKSPFHRVYVWAVVLCLPTSIVLAIWGFAIGNLTPDQRFILKWILPIFSGFAAGAFSGSLSFTESLAKNTVIAATGGFAVWCLSHWFLPVPKETQKHIYVELMAGSGETIPGEFTVRFNRPGTGSDTKPGTDGKLTITGYPIESDELEVLAVSHNAFQTEETSKKKPAPWKYPIKANQVIIRMERKFVAIGKPKKEEIIEYIRDAGLNRETILKPVLTPEEKKKATLTIKNLSGRDLELWFFDCATCYIPRKPDSKSQFSDIRIRHEQNGLNIRTFDRFSDFFDTDSGYFALFIRYNSSGEQKGQQYIGIQNLFRPPNRELVIGSNGEPGKPFTAEFTKVESPQ